MSAVNEPDDSDRLDGPPAFLSDFAQQCLLDRLVVLAPAADTENGLGRTHGKHCIVAEHESAHRADKRSRRKHIRQTRAKLERHTIPIFTPPTKWCMAGKELC